MKRLLLISAEFPPPVSVNGLIPARLAAHLPSHGWEVEVVRSTRIATRARKPATKPAHNPGRHDPFGQWLPFGEAVFDVPQMLRDARAIHAAKPVDAILTNAAPVAACLAGDRLARRIARPVVHMHGDPWGPCRQRQGNRPFWTAFLETRAETGLNHRAAGLILNTETARRDYLKAFPFLAPDRVHALRSPHDAAALSGLEVAGFDTPTLLFPGGLSEHVPPGPLFALAEALAGRGAGGALQMVLTKDPGPRPQMSHLPLHVIDPVPQAAMMSLMAKADILLAISQRSDQRIPLKLSDYLCAERPVLVLEQAHNPELRAFMEEAGMGAVFALDDIQGAADWVRSELANGRFPTRARNPEVVARLSAHRKRATGRSDLE